MLHLSRSSVSFLFLGALAMTACEDHRDSPNASFPDRINFTAQRQYPEGITYSGQLAQFLVSSVTQGKVGTVNTAGQYADLLMDDQLISAMGMKAVGERLLVCNGDQGISVKSTSESAFHTAKLFVFNLNTRQIERRVDLGALLPGVRHLANDLAYDPQGNVYVTDSFAPVVYKVTSDGQASILVNNDRFAGQGFNLNGIVYHPDGYLIVVKTNEGKLFKIDLKNGNAISEVGNLTLNGGDGMTLLNGDVYVVTGSGSKVSQVRSTDGWQTATLVKEDTDGYFQATTNVAVNGSIYTLNARIGEVSAAVMAMNPGQLQSNDYSIQKFR